MEEEENNAHRIPTGSFPMQVVHNALTQDMSGQLLTTAQAPSTLIPTSIPFASVTGPPVSSIHHAPLTTTQQADPGLIMVVPATSRPNGARLDRTQCNYLELEFQRNAKPTTEKKKQIATMLNVDLPKINNWFQNRRAKEKQKKKQGGHSNPGFEVMTVAIPPAIVEQPALTGDNASLNSYQAGDSAQVGPLVPHDAPANFHGDHMQNLQLLSAGQSIGYQPEYYLIHEQSVPSHLDYPSDTSKNSPTPISSNDSPRDTNTPITSTDAPTVDDAQTTLGSLESMSDANADSRRSSFDCLDGSLPLHPPNTCNQYPAAFPSLLVNPFDLPAFDDVEIPMNDELLNSEPSPAGLSGELAQVTIEPSASPDAIGSFGTFTKMGKPSLAARRHQKPPTISTSNGTTDLNLPKTAHPLMGGGPSRSPGLPGPLSAGLRSAPPKQSSYRVNGSRVMKRQISSAQPSPSHRTFSMMSANPALLSMSTGFPPTPVTAGLPPDNGYFAQQNTIHPPLNGSGMWPVTDMSMCEMMPDESYAIKYPPVCFPQPHELAGGMMPPMPPHPQGLIQITPPQSAPPFQTNFEMSFLGQGDIPGEGYQESVLA